MSTRIVAIIQARLGSSRLPLKSLLTLRGLPVIDWVTRRVGQSKRLSGMIVAIPDTPLDSALANHLQRINADYVTGPENDVLKRFTLAAEASHADLIVRICADNPLVSGAAIDNLIDFYTNANCDYAYNHIPRNNLWPDGFGAEIASAELLREMDEQARLPAQREHCFNYIWDNASAYSIRTFNPAEPFLCRPDLKLDLDSVEDFQRLSALSIQPEMSMAEIIAACPATM